MEELLTWGAANAHWIWWGLGLLLLAGEMVITGVYLLWIGIAGLATGLVAFFMPGMGFDGHGLVFAAFGAASIYIGNRYFYAKFEEAGDPVVNTRGRSHVGRTYVVCAPIINGRGHVKVGDSQWLASGPDAAEGTRVKVLSVDGTVLMVEPVQD
ncbi:NfeD family protein [Kordiimonas gwangyangensis]|uniref:NfeD family protein n=1 Tax=Kordiimonas gwangyangensis TaxID=288022 RepID=UPI0003638DBF|nr:NfeD family protein [Kordiimonas gwangyangensis]